MEISIFEQYIGQCCEKVAALLYMQVPEWMNGTRSISVWFKIMIDSENDVFMMSIFIQLYITHRQKDKRKQELLPFICMCKWKHYKFVPQYFREGQNQRADIESNKYVP